MGSGLPGAGQGRDHGKVRQGVREGVEEGQASIFHWLVEWGWVASLPVSWLGLCRLGVTVCRVSSRGGRAFPGARGLFLQGRGGQEAVVGCLWCG